MVEEEAGIEVVDEVDSESDAIFIDSEEILLCRDFFVLPILFPADAVAPEDLLGEAWNKERRSSSISSTSS